MSRVKRLRGALVVILKGNWLLVEDVMTSRFGRLLLIERVSDSVSAVDGRLRLSLIDTVVSLLSFTAGCGSRLSFTGCGRGEPSCIWGGLSSDGSKL